VLQSLTLCFCSLAGKRLLLCGQASGIVYGASCSNMCLLLLPVLLQVVCGSVIASTVVSVPNSQTNAQVRGRQSVLH
jgi:hypothetical protein